MFALARTGKMPARSSCSQDDGTVGQYISSYIVLQYIVLQPGASTSWGLVGAVEWLDAGLDYFAVAACVLLLEIRSL
jgi:hypothetical protein